MDPGVLIGALGMGGGAQELGSAQQYFVRPASFPNYTAGMDNNLFPFANEPTLGLMDAGMDVRVAPAPCVAVPI